MFERMEKEGLLTEGRASWPEPLTGTRVALLDTVWLGPWVAMSRGLRSSPDFLVNGAPASLSEWGFFPFTCSYGPCKHTWGAPVWSVGRPSEGHERRWARAQAGHTPLGVPTGLPGPMPTLNPQFWD